MAIAFDASAEKETATAPTSPQTWTHTPTGTPKGVVVSIVQLGGSPASATDFITAVTYGGVALSRVRRATDIAGGKGASDLWFLGTGVPTGAQTVSVTFAATTVKYHFVSMTFTAAGDIELVASSSIDGDTTDPSVTLAYGGRTCQAVAAEFCGKSDPAVFVVNSNCTVVQTFGVSGAGVSSIVLRQTTPGSADFAIGGTMTLDDSAYVAAAFSEVVTIPANTSDVASSTFTGGTETTGGNLVIPVTTLSGDDIFVLVTSRDHTVADPSPTCTDNDTTGNVFQLLSTTPGKFGSRFWKKATAASAGKTVTIAGAIGSCAAGMTVFRNAFAGGDPTTNLATGSFSGTALALAGFTPDYAGSEICLGIFGRTDDQMSLVTIACTNPGSLEPEHFLCRSIGGNDCAVALYSAPQSGGLSGTGTFTGGMADLTNDFMTWAIRPSVTTASSTATSALQNPTHTYGAAGTYTVSLTVTDNDGNLSIATSRSVTVT